MRILAFDTAGSGCSACLWLDGTVLARRDGVMERGQAEALVPLLQTVLAEAGSAWADLDRLAVTVGPGSFTGVRVGLATARGLSLAAGLPVVGITTAEAFVHALPAGGRAPGTVVLAAVDARREEVFLQPFAADRLTPLGEVIMVAPQDLDRALVAWGLEGDDAPPLLAVGDGAALLAGHPALVAVLPQEAPDPVVIAALAADRPLGDGPPSALYVRPPDAMVPAGGGRLRP